MTVTIQDPCYYCNAAGCGHCNPALDTTPAGIVRYAADRLNADGMNIVGDYSIGAALADLLATIGDEMADEGATGKEFSDQRPRWQVVDTYGKGWAEHTAWHEALKLARVILGMPDPNTTVESAR